MQKSLTCDTCDAPATHQEFLGGGLIKRQCCRCWIAAGQPPADWHSDCMAQYEKLRLERV